MLTISQTAQASGLTVKAVRYYADISLLKESSRTKAGYRLYDKEAVAMLGFIRRVRDFGFSIPQCKELLAMFDQSNRKSADVKLVAQAHLARLEKQRAELDGLCQSLSALVNACPGDQGSVCPIIDHLV